MSREENSIMTTNFSFHQNIPNLNRTQQNISGAKHILQDCCYWLGAVITLSIIFISTPSLAEPYLAYKTNNKCSACHVNPVGGGARNTYGNFYGTRVLPAKAGDDVMFDPGALADTLRIGTDIRANFTHTNQEESATDDTTTTQGFETQNAQVYLHFQPKGSRFSFYLDEQVAPGAALTREAFVLARLGKSHYIKAGRMMLPYGIRLEDDSAFVRQFTQFNFDNNDNGVELGLEFQRAVVNFAVTNGTSSDRNEDDKLQYLVKTEWLGNNWRVGGNALINQSSGGDRQMYGAYAGINLAGFTFLFEADRIRDESIQNAFGDDIEQNIFFAEVNRQIRDGLNLKLTYELADPDINIDENQRTRSSAVAEYTPVSNVQFRGGLRIGDDIPQRDIGNFNTFFVQAHFYY